MSSEKKEESKPEDMIGCFMIPLFIGFVIWVVMTIKGNMLDKAEYQGFIAGKVGASQEECIEKGDFKERWMQGWERGNSERKNEK